MQVDNFGNTRIGTMDLFVQKQKQAQNKTAEADDAEITLGNTTHTKKEWEDMMRKLDRYLEMVKEEQKTRLKQQQKQAEEKKIYARLDQKARDQKKRLLNCMSTMPSISWRKCPQMSCAASSHRRTPTCARTSTRSCATPRIPQAPS